MWLVNKDDSIYFPISVFIGKSDSDYFLYVFANCPCKKDKIGTIEFQYNQEKTIQTNEVYFINYNEVHKVILAKDMYKFSQGIKKSRNIDIYYYPKSIKFKNIEAIHEFLKEVINDERRNN